MENNQKITAAILAGGKSQRMGTNKAFLLINNEPIISHTVTTLREITHDLLIVTNHPELYAEFQVTVVRDLQLGLGPIGAILTALSLTENSHVLVVACDLPFLNLRILHKMTKVMNGFDVVAPRSDYGLEPLCAIYNRSCLPTIKYAISQGELSVFQLFKQLKVHQIPPEEWQPLDPTGYAFLNLNTLEDYRLAQNLEIQESFNSQQHVSSSRTSFDCIRK